MLVKGELFIRNRLLPDAVQRPCQASLAVIKTRKNGDSEVMHIVVYSARNKTGTKYQVFKNLHQVHSKFIKDGKTTICFKEPPHDLCLSKANPDGLKKLIHALKLGLNRKNLQELRLNSVVPSTINLEKPKTNLTITKRAEYPTLKSFPSTLEKLTINTCRLKMLEARILRLSKLTMLDLSDNLLSVLPDSMDSLSTLREFDLSQNQFERWPRCLFTPSMSKQLRLLKLNENKLKYIPHQIQQLQTLINLQLNGNELTSIGCTIGNVTSLRFLDISNNRIQHLTSNFMKLRLDTLDIAGNPWEHRGFNEVIENRLEGIPTLREICARIIKVKRASVSSEDLPGRLFDYVMSADECKCGRPCYEHRAYYMTQVDVRTIAHTIISDDSIRGRTVIPKEGSLCSTKCLQMLIASTFY